MIIKLKNNGGYDGLEAVTFPVAMRARRISKHSACVVVSGSDLNSLMFSATGHFEYTKDYIFLDHEFEVIEE